MSILGGAVGKALLSQLLEGELDDILSKHRLKKYTPHSCVHKKRFKEMLLKAREGGVASIDEEHTAGACRIAVPLKTKK